jgi:hypothetical protein
MSTFFTIIVSIIDIFSSKLDTLKSTLSLSSCVKDEHLESFVGVSIGLHLDMMDRVLQGLMEKGVSMVYISLIYHWNSNNSTWMVFHSID